MKTGKSILFVSSYPPRECGIATFTKDLTTAIDKQFNPVIKFKILAMNNDGVNIYNYSDDVTFQIDDTDIQDYINTAKKINNTDSIKLVNIQHEFGIFGGKTEKYLLPFLDTLTKPVVITFHSVIPNPNPKLKRIVQLFAEKVKCIIVMNEIAVDTLKNDYNVKNNIVIIPHGIHPVPFTTNLNAKKELGFDGKTILTSFGLIRETKGSEYVIDALPKVIEKFPNILFLIIGETHPILRKEQGEKYRNFLEQKVKNLNLQEHVKFYNKYMELEEILKYLGATDIYISSSNNPNQVTSGTVSYAMGCGRVVISTPFLHARDAVIPERGLLVEFRNSKSFTDAIIKVLSNPKLKEKMEKNAYDYTRHMTWSNVAQSYLQVFNKILNFSS